MTAHGSTPTRTPAPDPRRYAALLFDMDGTLIDSMPLHAQSWVVWHAELGLPYHEAGFFEATAGRTNEEIIGDMFPDRSAADVERLAHRKEDIYRDLALQTLQMIPEADRVCRQAREAGLKLAICTAAPPANIDVADRRLGIRSWVDVVACPADGLRGKPHPDIFLAAAARLDVDPALCLVYEDAPLGVEAARRAGMDTVALTTTLAPAAFAPYPNVVDVIADFRGYAVPAQA